MIVTQSWAQRVVPLQDHGEWLHPPSGSFSAPRTYWNTFQVNKYFQRGQKGVWVSILLSWKQGRYMCSWFLGECFLFLSSIYVPHFMAVILCLQLENSFLNEILKKQSCFYWFLKLYPEIRLLYLLVIEKGLWVLLSSHWQLHRDTLLVSFTSLSNGHITSFWKQQQLHAWPEFYRRYNVLLPGS